MNCRELQAALEDLGFLLDERLQWWGGYPAEYAICANGELIAIADVDENAEPQLTVLSVDKFLTVWRKAIGACDPLLRFDANDERNIAACLYEAGYPDDCLAEIGIDLMAEN